MNVNVRRKAVSPIIATLLLIAITVAAGIVVYVFVGGLSSNLSKSGGNQVTEQLSQDAYNFATPAGPWSITVRNTGTGASTLSTVYYNGIRMASVTSVVLTPPYYISAESCEANPATANDSLAVGSTCTFTFTLKSGAAASTSGTSNQVKLITSDGAMFTYNVLAGSSG